VAAQSPVFSVISAGDFEVIANIPEVDIARVAVGNTARVTLDAYSQDEVFLATVSEIDPAERIIDGIATYQVTLTFNAEDPLIRSGMTANISIETTRKEDTVFIPERAIVNNDGKKTVRLLNADQTITEKEVTTGLRGLLGTIEIISGLSGGETVVTFVKE
jgi:HlyD family secretion protein